MKKIKSNEVSLEELKQFFENNWNKTFLVIEVYNGLYVNVFKSRHLNINLEDSRNGKRGFLYLDDSDSSKKIYIGSIEKTSYGFYYRRDDDSDTFETLIFNIKYKKNLIEAVSYLNGISDKLEKMKKDIDKVSNLLHHEWWDRISKN